MGHTAGQGLVFALPPSMGLASIRPVARQLADLLSAVGFSTVWPTRSYAQLEEALATGEAHAAWAPPALCARVQDDGGEVMFRAVRMGATSYRSALLCRGERSIDLKRLAAMSSMSQIRCAWVDRRSVAGYLMPRRYLRQRGADLSEALRETLMGSYQACFDAVLEGDADLTASYVGKRGSGYIDLLGNCAAELRVLAWTDEIPNDGVVVSPALSDDDASQVEYALNAAFRDIRLADKLALTFDADGFDVPDLDSYSDVSALIANNELAHDDDLDAGGNLPGIGGRLRRARTNRPTPGFESLRVALEPNYG